MAEFPINPIPYQGGTLEWEHNKLDMIRLNNSRIIYAFSQSDPSYKFYGIADVNDFLATSPSVTIVKQRAFTGAFSNMRLQRLDNDRFISYDGKDLYVYNVSTDDVVEELKVTDWSTDFYQSNPVEWSWSTNVGTNQIVEVSFVLDTPATTPTYKFVIRTITYNPGTTSFTVSTPKTIVPGVSTSSIKPHAVNLKMIAGSSTKVLVNVHGSNASDPFEQATQYSLEAIGVYDLTTDTIDVISPATISSYGNSIGFGENAIVAIPHNGTDAIEYDGSVWSSPFSYAGDSGTHKLHECTTFSPSYGMLLFKPDPTGSGGFEDGDNYFRIINRQGVQTVVTSFPTNTDDGLLVQFPTDVKPWFCRDRLDVFDAETVLIPCFNTDPANKQFVFIRIKP